MKKKKKKLAFYTHNDNFDRRRHIYTWITCRLLPVAWASFQLIAGYKLHCTCSWTRGMFKNLHLENITFSIPLWLAGCFQCIVH